MVFVVSPKLLHLLGAERFGVLMIALVTPIIASQLDLGICASAVRHMASRLHNVPVDAGMTLFTFFASLSVLGLVLGAVLWSTARPLSVTLGLEPVLGPEQASNLIRMCAVWAAVSLGALVPGLLARAAQALVLLTAVQTLSTLTLWLGAWWLLSSGRTLLDVVSLGIAVSVSTGLATLWLSRSLIRWHGTWRFSISLLLAEARFSAGMFAAQAASTLVYQGDRILIAVLGSTGMAGLYSMCSNVANKTSAAAVSLNSFVMPHAAGLSMNGKKAETNGLVHALDRTTAVLVIPILIPALALAEPFLRLWVGTFATDELVTTFRVLLVAFAIPSFAMPVSNVLIGGGHSTFSARFAWLTVVIYLFSVVVLVPRLGLIGAAVAMLLGNSSSLAFAVAARRLLNIEPAPGRRVFWAGLAGGSTTQLLLLMVLSSSASNWYALFTIGLLVWASSFGTRAILKVLSPEELQLARRAERKALQ